MAKQQFLVRALTASFLLIPAFGSLAVGATKQWANNAQCPGAATGNIYGAPFKLDRADYNATTLSLRQGEDRNSPIAARIAITFPKPLDLENTVFSVDSRGKATVVLANKTKASLPSVSITKTTNGSASGPKSGSTAKNYLMTLQFYTIQKGKLPGFINFQSADDGSSIKGYFFAEKGAEGDGFY